MLNLYLDDFRHPTDSFYYMGNPIYNKLTWEVVRNYDDFVKFIEERGIPDTVSFDHDLSDIDYEHQTAIDYDIQEKTGFHCAKWLINYCMDNKKELPATVLIHSMNPAGSLNIKSLFDTYYKYHEKGLM